MYPAISKPLPTKLFNIVSDVGVQLSAGNACLFWNGSTATQIISLSALAVSLGVKTVQEFSQNPPSLLADPNTAFKATTLSVVGIGIDSFIQLKKVIHC